MIIIDWRNRKYIDYIISLLDEGIGVLDNYRCLLYYLYECPYTLFGPESVQSMDQNRIDDGIELRYNLGKDLGFSNAEIIHFLDNKDCTFLELIAALVFRCNENILGYNSDIFLKMLINSELCKYSDDKFEKRKVDDILNRIMYREYYPNGIGGFFKCNSRYEDLRVVELWYQMCWYIDENY